MTNDLPSSGAIRDGVHFLPARVYYEDTDFTGVVYHANYLRFMERGRSEYLRIMTAQAGDRDPGLFAVIRVEIDFKAPARIHDALIIQTRFEGLKGPRLRFTQEIYKDEKLLCSSVVVAVAINSEGRPRRPDAAEQAMWNAHKAPNLPA